MSTSYLPARLPACAFVSKETQRETHASCLFAAQPVTGCLPARLSLPDARLSNGWLDG